jgi:hypothetical protein
MMGVIAKRACLIGLSLGFVGLVTFSDIHRVENLPLGGALTMSTAHAVFGRPLTPLSYAGMARRTARRTARRWRY